MDRHALRVAGERIKRFERLGGVDLSRKEEDESHRILAEVRSGIATYKKTVFHFRCGICGHKVEGDMEMEPLCTGPNWTDDHPPEIMEALPDNRRMVK